MYRADGPGFSERRLTGAPDTSARYYMDDIRSRLNRDDMRNAGAFAKPAAFPLDGTNGFVPAAKSQDDFACEIAKRIPEALISAGVIELGVELAHAAKRLVE
jgi:hypothetical protein